MPDADTDADRRAAYIAAVLATAPPPTPEQVAKVCAVLRAAPRSEPLPRAG